MDIGDNVFYTRSIGLRVPAKVVGHSDEGYVELEYHQDGVRVINHRCPMDGLSFGIPSWDSPPPSPSSPPAADIPGDATGGSPLRGRSPTPSPSSPSAAHVPGDTSGGTPLRGRSPLRTSSRSPSHSHAPSRSASPTSPGPLSEDEEQEVRPAKRESQTSAKSRARDKEVRQLAKTLPVQLTNEQWAEVCEWLEDNTPSTGRRYSGALMLHDDVAAVGCSVSVFVFTMQCIYVVCVCLSQAIQQCGSPLPPPLWDSKGAFKVGGSHRLRQSNIPAGSGTQHATPVLQYMDHIEKKIGDLHHRETSFLDQLKERFSKFATPKQLTLEKCGPLERTIFMRRFRTAHIAFWAKEHPHYIEQDIAVPKIVQQILTLGKGHHLPKDTDGPCCFLCRGYTAKGSETRGGCQAGSEVEFISATASSQRAAYLVWNACLQFSFQF